jgi:hypothetical protein
MALQVRGAGPTPDAVAVPRTPGDGPDRIEFDIPTTPSTSKVWASYTAISFMAPAT